MHRTAGRPDAVKPAGGRGRQQQQPRRPQQAQRRDGHRPAQAQAKPQQAPRGAAPAPRGGDAPLRRPASAAAPERKDRGWRDADFRDGGTAPAFLRRS
jgi:hypothetical protein